MEDSVGRSGDAARLETLLNEMRGSKLFFSSDLLIVETELRSAISQEMLDRRHAFFERMLSLGLLDAQSSVFKRLVREHVSYMVHPDL